MGGNAAAQHSDTTKEKQKAPEDRCSAPQMCWSFLVTKFIFVYQKKAYIEPKINEKRY